MAELIIRPGHNDHRLVENLLAPGGVYALFAQPSTGWFLTPRWLPLVPSTPALPRPAAQRCSSIR